jgi:6-pyruvoyltetrahydropterin/6-carboxytetrahydropterin synthase
MYRSTKQYGHDVGISCAFRQHKAGSHCSLIHGYALAFKFVFEANELDDREWVIDFGGLRSLKAVLEEHFDHKLLVAEDDPYKDEICALGGLGVADVLVVPTIGCESFASMGFLFCIDWLVENGHGERVRLVSCEVKEHGANSAIYLGV